MERALDDEVDTGSEREEQQPPASKKRQLQFVLGGVALALMRAVVRFANLLRRTGH